MSESGEDIKRRILALDAAERGRSHRVPAEKPTVIEPPTVTASVDDVVAFRDSIIEDARHQHAVDAHNRAIAEQVADLVANAHEIDDPALLEQTYSSVNALSPQAGAALLEAAVYSQPEVVAELQAQRAWEEQNGLLEAERQAEQAVIDAQVTAELERLTHAAKTVGVQPGAVIIAGTEYDLEPERAAVMARAESILSEKQRLRQALVDDAWESRPLRRAVDPDGPAQLGADSLMRAESWKVTLHQRTIDQQKASMLEPTPADELKAFTADAKQRHHDLQAFRRLHNIPPPN